MKTYQKVAWVLISAIGGFLIVALPPLVLRGPMGSDYSLFAVARNGIENLEFLISLPLLAFFGMLLSWRVPEHWYVPASATMLLFFVLAIAEMMLKPGSHNLWPSEFGLYAAMSIPALLGALGEKMERSRKYLDAGKRNRKLQRLGAMSTVIAFVSMEYTDRFSGLFYVGALFLVTGGVFFFVLPGWNGRDANINPVQDP